MKYRKYLKPIYLLFIYCSHFSCDDFIEVDIPDQKIISETVFSNDQTATRAVVGIYNNLFKSDFSSGGFRSVTMLGGLSSGEFQTTTINDNLIEFEKNEIAVDNTYNLGLWSSAYNVIYMCNSVLDGLDSNYGVSLDVKDHLTGEVLFIRAFTYFYLVNLYGKVPLLLTSDYKENSQASRSGIEEIYNTIIADLQNSISLLESSFINGERLRANKLTSMALLARVYLYLDNWEMAEQYSTQVIKNSNNLILLRNPDEIFLANSKEAIWQVSPAGGGALSYIANEARVFILNSTPPQSQQPVVLSNDVLKLYSKTDIRYESWIGIFQENDKIYYYPNKYKINNSNKIIEYSTLMRLAEQYLIRAEARAHLGKITEGITDLDKIRERANIEMISNLNLDINKNVLLDSIRVEWQRELFAEWGHKWLDLKRNNMSTKVLKNNKTMWQDSDVLYPIPKSERVKNPNLTQNVGY